MIIGSHVPLGSPLFLDSKTPENWVREIKRLGYGAAYCPVELGSSNREVNEYKEAALENNIIIAEVGAWSNTLSPDWEEREQSVKKCIESLELAESLGAKCCVNISGSNNAVHWAGPHRDNLTEQSFDQIVETTRRIIDAVKPNQAYFALEAMPWAYPDSSDNYVRLVDAIDRDQFGVHLDPVNFVISPQVFFRNARMIEECFEKLGPRIVSCHGKDITLREDNYIPQLDEVRPGLGNLDYKVFLRELAKLDDVPLMMEHLDTANEYALGAAYIRSVGELVGVTL